MKKVLLFVGTRPEAIKLAPVISALEGSRLQPVVVSTGQHREMLAQVISLFDIHIDHDFDLMMPNQSLASFSGRLLAKIDALLQAESPDMAIVQGDTTTVLMAALSCFYREVPVAHVEAGLRTGNVRSPFPEEANRRLVTPIVDLHFAATQLARDNLLAEGVRDESIFVTGNTVVDALKREVAQQAGSEIRNAIADHLRDILPFDRESSPYVLITGHRRENFGAGLRRICEAIVLLAERFPNVQFVYPVHLNPNVQAAVHASLGELNNVHLIAPQNYRLFVALMQSCRLILTDSGGIQEEAPSLGRPLIVLRDTTERPEGLGGSNPGVLATDTETIVARASEILSAEPPAPGLRSDNPYGDGNASARIVEALESYLYPDALPG